MPKKKTIKDLSTQTVSTDISPLNDSHVNRIRKEFAFLDSYNIQVGIEDAIYWYKLLAQMPREPTSKQSNIRLNFVQDKISELTCTLNSLSHAEKTLITRESANRPQKFCANSSIDNLNELSLQIGAAQSKLDDVTDKVGFNQKTHQSVFLSTLYTVYEDGTGQKVKYWYDNYETKYRGSFVEFCEYVINIYSLNTRNSSIGEFVKNMRKAASKKS